MKAMMIKEFRELRRDKRTVAMLVGMPLMLLVIFGYAANFTITTLTVSIHGPGAEQLVTVLEANPQAAERLDVTVVDPAGDLDAARANLRDDHTDIAVVTSAARTDGAATPLLLIDGSNLFAAQSASILAAQLGEQVDSEILFNPDLDTSWVMVPALIGLILAFIGTIITSIGLVKEREAGTLEQLAVMPLKPSAVILGKIAPYFVVACLDMVLITVVGMGIFGVPFNGPVGPFIVGAALFLFVVLGMGVLISTISATTGQAVQVAIMTMMPQVLLSGMIFPLTAMAAGVRWIGYLLPLTWFTKVSQGVMLRGASWSSLWFPLLILALMAIIFFGVAVLRLRRDLRPAPQHTNAPHLATAPTSPAGDR